MYEYSEEEKKIIRDYIDELPERKSAYFKGRLIKAIFKGVNVIPALDAKYTTAQKTEILNGMLSNVDYTIYANDTYSSQKMHEIRVCLESGITGIPIQCHYNVIRSFRQIQRDKLLKQMLK